MDIHEFKDSHVWQLIERELHRYRLALMDDLRSVQLAEVENIRGKLDAVDYIAAMPDVLFSNKERL